MLRQGDKFSFIFPHCHIIENIFPNEFSTFSIWSSCQIFKSYTLSHNDPQPFLLLFLKLFCKYFLLHLLLLLPFLHSQGIRVNPAFISSGFLPTATSGDSELYLPLVFSSPSTIPHVNIFIPPQIALIILLPAKNNLLAAQVLKMGNFTYLSQAVVKTHCLFLPYSFTFLYWNLMVLISTLYPILSNLQAFNQSLSFS